jgi:DNA repair protein RecN (Recombination protein N)
MLAALSIRNIVLIDRLDLEIDRGLTALTGETGAGKSIMLDALGLALGGRGDGSLVRTGADQGSVTAVFDIAGDHEVRGLLADNDLDGDGDLLIRRVQSADGRARAFINDQPVSVQLLRSIGGRLVEIHGQHDNRALLEADSHLGLVDAFAGLGGEVAALGEAWQAWQQAKAKLATHREAIDQARRDRDYLEHSVDELERLAPRAGEETELADLRQLMMNAEKFTEDLREAEGALAGDGTVEARLNAAMRKLGRAAERASGRLDAAVGAIDRALAEMAEARGAVAAAIADIEHDPKTLETTEERLFALRAMARKHSVPVDRLPELLAEMTARLAALASDETTLAALDADVAKAREGYCRKAATLSGQRVAAARTLDGKVMAELPPLKLEKARFETAVASLGEAGAGPRGWDRVEFMVSANPGTPLGPLRKIASGGELARFMLALKVVLAARGSAPTLIFDEIDTGVGGAVAEAIGVRLARLADGLQVLAVTHSPQVAARADIHMRISKEADGSAADDRVVTRVEALSKDTRREEIARMLAGARVTDEARAAADRLIGSEA